MIISHFPAGRNPNILLPFYFFISLFSLTIRLWYLYTQTCFNPPPPFMYYLSQFNILLRPSLLLLLLFMLLSEWNDSIPLWPEWNELSILSEME